MREDIKVGRCKEKVSKVLLHEYLEAEIQPKTLGMDEDHLPEKTWLMNTLFTLNSNH